MTFWARHVLISHCAHCCLSMCASQSFKGQLDNVFKRMGGGASNVVISILLRRESVQVRTSG